MSGAFGVASARLAALAAGLLGWRPAEFWAATPAELATSLGLTEADSGPMLDRGALQRLMDKDDDRPG